MAKNHRHRLRNYPRSMITWPNRHLAKSTVTSTLVVLLVFVALALIMAAVAQPWLGWADRGSSLTQPKQGAKVENGEVKELPFTNLTLGRHLRRSLLSQTCGFQSPHPESHWNHDLLGEYLNQTFTNAQEINKFAHRGFF